MLGAVLSSGAQEPRCRPVASPQLIFGELAGSWAVSTLGPAWWVAPERGRAARVPDGAGSLVELEQFLLCLQLSHQSLQRGPPLLTVLHLQLQVVLRVPLSQEPACDVLAEPVGRKQV